MSALDALRARRSSPLVAAALRVVERARALGPSLAEGSLPAVAGGRPVRRFALPRARPFESAERRAVRRAMALQCTSRVDGDVVRDFEAALARSFDVPHAIATSSGTSALMCALRAAGVGQGDEVVVPALTFAATALAVLHVGATPVFADVDARTWNVGAPEVERVLGPRTRALLPVHIGGVPCDLDSLLALARARGLVVIEDAAQAHGARWNGRAAGTLGDLGCTSFQSAKAITTGEGGSVFARDAELARRARLAHNFGERTSSGVPTSALSRFEHAPGLDYELAGWNHNLGALAAALGTAQLARLDAVRAAYRTNAQRLWSALASVDGLDRQLVPAGAEACGTLVFFTVDPARAGCTRDELTGALRAEKIDCRASYAQALPAHTVFGADARWREHFPNAARITERGLGLRVDRALGPFEMDQTARAVRRFLAWKRTNGRTRSS